VARRRIANIFLIEVRFFKQFAFLFSAMELGCMNHAEQNLLLSDCEFSELPSVRKLAKL
jgi:hypothetical protein